MQRPATPLSQQVTYHARSRGSLDMLMLSVDPMWPLNRDHSAVGCRVARHLARRGRRVAIASLRPTPPLAPAWVSQLHLPWPAADAGMVHRLADQWSGPTKDLRFATADRLGIRPADLAGVIELVHRHRPRVVIALGPGGPALLSGVRAANRTATTVWLGPRCPALESLSRLLDLPWQQKPAAATTAVLSLLAPLPFIGSIDRVAAATRTGARLMALTAAAPRTVTVPRGINLDRYRPGDAPIRPRTAVTWAPDLCDPTVTRSLTRFARHTWPRLRDAFPDARWTILGRNPGPDILALKDTPGIIILGDTADPRTFARRCRLFLWPGRSPVAGGKPILEAMAMGLPTVLSRPAATRLRITGPLRPRRGEPVAACLGQRQWLDAIAALWLDPTHAAAAGRAARTWATTHAHWPTNTDELDRLIALSRRQHGKPPATRPTPRPRTATVQPATADQTPPPNPRPRPYLRLAA